MWIGRFDSIKDGLDFLLLYGMGTNMGSRKDRQDRTCDSSGNAPISSAWFEANYNDCMVLVLVENLFREHITF